MNQAKQIVKSLENLDTWYKHIFFLMKIITYSCEENSFLQCPRKWLFWMVMNAVYFPRRYIVESLESLDAWYKDILSSL